MVAALPEGHFPTISTKNSFTLIEVVVALAIFATVMTLAGAGLSASVRSWEKVGRAKDRLAERVAIDSLANNVIRNAIPFTWPDSISKKEKPVFKGERDSLRVASRRWMGSIAEGGILFVELSCRNGSLLARYSKIPITDATPEPGALSEEVIASGVERISFLYADRNEREEIIWQESWDSEQNENLPLAIQMKIDWRDGRSEVWLRRTAGSGFRENFGLRKVYAPDQSKK